MHLRLSPITQSKLDMRRDRHAHLPGYGGPDLATVISRAVHGILSEEIHATTRSHAIQGRLRLDDVSAALIRHLGMEPVVLAMLCHLVGDVEVVDTSRCVEEATIILMRDAGARIVPTPGTRVLWNAERSAFMVPALPEQLLTLVVGRPLSGVMSHPALDTLDLTVTGRVTVGPQTLLHVRTRRWLSAREIANLLGDPS